MKKHTLIFVALYILLAPSLALSQTFVEAMSRFDKSGNATPTFDGQFAKAVDDSQGIFVWGLTTEGWREIYASYYRNLTPWLQVSGGMGVEKADKPIRFGASVWMGKGKISSFLALEDGGSGFWYTYTGTYALSNRVQAGVFSRRFVGTGPYLEVKLVGKTSVWTTYCPKSGNTMFALKQGF